MIALIVLAIGLVMIVEGLAYVLAPSLIEQVLEILRSLPEASRRQICLLYTSPSPRDKRQSRMPSSA